MGSGSAAARGRSSVAIPTLSPPRPLRTLPEGIPGIASCFDSFVEDFYWTSNRAAPNGRPRSPTAALQPHRAVLASPRVASGSRGGHAEAVTG